MSADNYWEEEARRYTALRADNKTGYRGVVKHHLKFMATIKFNGRQIRLGTFDTAKEASDFYEAVAEKLLTHYEGRENE